MLLIALIWFSRTLSFVKYITENGVEISQIFSLFVLILPWLLLFILPISLFVAILIIYNRLLSNNEITILKNSGLTKIAIGKPVFMIASVAVIIGFFISLFLMPYSNKKLRLTKTNFENNYSNLSFSEGAFESLKKLTFYIKNKDAENKLYGILINDEREDAAITITAKSGYLITEDFKLLLYMQKGTVQKVDRTNSKTQILNFDDYVFNLTENNQSENRNMRWKAKERYFNELINYEESLQNEEIAKYKGEIHQRLTYPLMPFVLAIIALAAILYGGFNRRGNAKNIALALAMATSFFSIMITLYRLIESNINLAWLLYLNIIFFVILSLYLLIYNPTKKNPKI